VRSRYRESSLLELSNKNTLPGYQLRKLFQVHSSAFEFGLDLHAHVSLSAYVQYVIFFRDENDAARITHQRVRSA
jgi:hypothetical protein